MNYEQLSGLFYIWGFIGLYYLLSIWFKPNLIVQGIGFSVPLIWSVIKEYLKDEEEVK